MARSVVLQCGGLSRLMEPQWGVKGHYDHPARSKLTQVEKEPRRAARFGSVQGTHPCGEYHWDDILAQLLSSRQERGPRFVRGISSAWNWAELQPTWTQTAQGGSASPTYAWVLHLDHQGKDSSSNSRCHNCVQKGRGSWWGWDKAASLPGECTGNMQKCFGE